MPKYKEQIEAVVYILDSTLFRSDQLETAGRINACSNKLKEILSDMERNENEVTNG